MENPILLALPQRRTDGDLGPNQDHRDCDEQELERLQMIETGSSPQIESALLRELLHRSPGLLPNLLDPTEVHNYSSALAGISSYKHRLQAIRGEYIHARIRAEDLEVQLKQSRYEIERLQKHIEYLDAIIEQMRASRGWKLVEKCSRLRQTVSSLVGRLLGSAKAR
ncbi:MAG TPA: hypothetical protein VH643_09760 [Gemmataceae bacterium]